MSEEVDQGEEGANEGDDGQDLDGDPELLLGHAPVEDGIGGVEDDLTAGYDHDCVVAFQITISHPATAPRNHRITTNPDF